MSRLGEVDGIQLDDESENEVDEEVILGDKCRWDCLDIQLLIHFDYISCLWRKISCLFSGSLLLTIRSSCGLAHSDWKLRTLASSNIRLIEMSWKDLLVRQYANVTKLCTSLPPLLHTDFYTIFFYITPQSSDNMITIEIKR